VTATVAALPPGIVTRPATEADLPDCAQIWRDGLNDYLVRLNQPEMPDDTTGLSRLHGHVRSTDPECFRVATRDGRAVAFGAAARRDEVWFLSMLFVRPGEQGSGLGAALLRELLPGDGDDAVLATATDVLQPISNALYARFDMVPRMPLLSLAGRPERPEALGSLPQGVAAIPFDEIVTNDPDGHARLTDVVAGIDRDLVGFSHPQDHRFLRQEGRRGYLYRDGSGTVVGYAYGAPSGRLGPVAVVDEALMAPVLGHLTSTIDARGAFAVWVPGAADRAVVPLLHAGFRLDGFPLFLCWSRDFADFRRYLPISPGLL
jgi:hypothetical protein